MSNGLIRLSIKRNIYSTIFKTIQDLTTGKTKITSSGLFNGIFKGDFFKAQPIVSESDIAALENYNKLLADNKPQEAFEQAMKNTSQTAQNLAKNAKGAAVDINAIPKASKAAAAGMKALSVAGNMLMSMGIAFAIQGLITLFDNLIHRSEKIQEAANNARSAIDDVKSSLDNLKTTTNDVKKRYAELAQEVNNLGKINQSQGSLSTDEYAEFLNLSNQLADLFPQLTRGYDDNGNAILSLSGNVGTIVGSLNDLVDVQQRLANLQILENMPDVWNGYINNVYDDGKINRSEYRDAIKQNKAEQDAILKMMSDLETGTTSSYNSLDSEFGAIGVEMYNVIDAALKQFNLSAPGLFRKEFTGIVGEELTHWDFSSLTREQMSAVKNALGTLADEYQKEIELTTGKLKTANAEMSGYINTWLSTEWNFNRLAPEMQNVVKDVLLNSDWISMLPDSVDASNWDEVSAWLQNNFLYAVNDIDSQQIKTALVDVFNGEFTVESLQGIIDQLIKTEGFDENNPLIIYLKTKMEGREEYEKNYDAAVNKYGAEGKAEIEKAFKKNSVDTQEELDNWIEVTKGAKDAAEAVDMYAESKKNANNPVSIGDLEGASDRIKTLGSAFKELSEDGYITTKTLGEIQTATGLSGDEWEDYKTKLLNAKAGSSEFNQIISEMTVKILDNAFAGRDLTSVTEDEIEAILRENGVVNASAVAKEYKARATLQAKLAEADYSNGIDAVVSALGSECKALGLTEQEVKDLATMYASAQQAMLDAVETGASARLNILKSELEGITGIAEAYALLGRGYDANGDGVNDYSAEEMDEMSAEDLKKYRADSAKIIAYGNAVEALKKIQEIDIDVPNYSGNTKDSGSDNKPDYEDPTDAIINRINLRSKELEKQEQAIEDAIETTELGGDVDSYILGELNKLGDGGTVNLSLRPQIDTEELNKKGWDAGEGFATVFSSAISNTDFNDLMPENAEDTVAINFTPIIVDPVTGEFKGVLSENELYSYAHDVLAGVREDDLNLQIGAKFEGEDAIDKAVSAGERIHNLHEGLLAETDLEKQISLTNDLIATRKRRVEELNNANAGLHNEAEYLRNSNPWDEESWFDSQGNATEAYNTLYNNSSKEEQEAIKDLFEKLSKYKEAYRDNAEEIDNINKEILQDEKKTTDIWDEYIQDNIDDLEHNIEIRSILDIQDKDSLNIADYEKIKDFAHQRAEDYRKAGYKETDEKIQKWQKIWIDANEKIIQIREDNLSNLIDDIDKATSAEIEALEEISESYDDIIGKYESLKQVKQSEFDFANSLRDEKNAITKAIATSRVSTQYLDEDERKFIFNEEDYEKLNSKIKDLAEWNTKAAKNYYDEINSLGDEELYKKEEITAEYERQLAMKQKELDVLKAEVDLRQKEQQLNNVLAEKNVKLMTENGWEWVADQDKVAQAMEEKIEAENALESAKTQRTQQGVLNGLQGIIDTNNTEKAANENKIKMINDASGKLKKAYENYLDPVEDIAVLTEKLRDLGIAPLIGGADKVLESIGKNKDNGTLSVTNSFDSLAEGSKFIFDGVEYIKPPNNEWINDNLFDLSNLTIPTQSDLIYKNILPTNNAPQYNIGTINIKEVANVDDFIYQLTQQAQSYSQITNKQ